jgi:hypothetical protein
MKYFSIVGGFTLIICGIYLTKRQIKNFIDKKQDQLGWDIRGLGAGLMSIMIGLYLILKHI